MGHFLAALLGKLCADEVKAWLPSIAEHLKELAVRRLPVEQRERYSEEWASYLNDTPGEIAKIWTALGFFRGAQNVPPCSEIYVYTTDRTNLMVICRCGHEQLFGVGTCGLLRGRDWQDRTHCERCGFNLVGFFLPNRPTNAGSRRR